MISRRIVYTAEPSARRESGRTATSDAECFDERDCVAVSFEYSDESWSWRERRSERMPGRSNAATFPRIPLA
jgi:hypothetical protein